MAEKKLRVCNLCEAMCGLEFTVDGGRITDVRADREDVFSRGHICPKGPAMREVYEHPDRLRRPVRRKPSGGWEEIGWEAALDEAAARLREVRERHGGDAIGVYLGNPIVHNHGASMLSLPFVKSLGTRNRFDANSQDANPKIFAALQMYGDALALTVPDVDRTDYLLMLGANPAASNGSVMTLGDVKGRLTGVRARGGRLVLIDPRRTETAAWADEHHFIRPGGDAAFVAALLHVVFESKLDKDVAEIARGLAELRKLVEPFSPERVATSVGIGAATIRRLAREFATARAAVAYGRVGTCQNELGATASWLIEALNVVTGNFDRPGGTMFANPAVDVARIGRKQIGGWGRWKSRVRGLPELGGQLPAAVMAEEMETPGEGQIRAFVTISGNPVLSTTNGPRLARALAGLEFMVSVDYFINETTEHAHLILPPMHALERGHYDVVFHAIAVRNTARWSDPVMPPSDEAREDWEILYELGMRMGGLRFGMGKSMDAAIRWAWRGGWRLSPDRLLDLALRIGPYGDRFIPGRRGLNLKRVKQAPHGIDLGPLRPARAQAVHTADGKVDLVPEVLATDVPRIDAWINRGANGLVLIGRRHVRSNNSWMHRCHSLVKGPDRTALLMNPADADARSLQDGQRVRVASRAGSVEARVERSDAMMRGVVSLPHGWNAPNVNAITDEMFLDPLSGTAALNGVPVSVELIPESVEVH